MKDNLNITIRIADVPPISMTIRRDAEERVREAERSVNRVWKTWRAEFDQKSSKEVLAMVAVQFARLYFELQHATAENRRSLEAFEAQLDDFLQLMPQTDASKA